MSARTARLVLPADNALGAAETTSTTLAGSPSTAQLVVDEPLVVDGTVTRVIEIEPYQTSPTPLGGCTRFTGRYVTDPDEIAAIARRVRGGKPC